jgi:ABC-type multidrug transport system ATPase subunit
VDIDIENVTKTFRGGVTALDGLSLHIPTGMFGLLGNNGAGKTTLMRILAGLLRPDGGRVVAGVHDLATKSGRQALKAELGYLPQDLGLYPDLTARQFLDYVALLKGLDDTADRRRRVGELLELVSLADVAGRRLKGFSGGMRRRMGIAQALLNDPPLLIVDEPTAGLDPEERIRFRTLLSQLPGSRTVLLSTHIVEDVAQTCRQVAILGKGQVRFRGTVDEVITHARGRVWTVTTRHGGPPPGVVVSALAHEDGTRYRVVADSQPTPDAEPLEPTLEDGYLALTGAAPVAG